jgi:hypothetical protein
MPDEFIFRGGLAVAALSAVAGIIAALVLRMRKRRLDALLDAEYGETKKQKRA